MSAARRRSLRSPVLGVLVTLCVLVPIAALTLRAESSSGRSVRAAASYGWPMKPFDRTHPIRSSFGDPRTMFNGPPTPATLYHGAGVFSFHNGIDIAVPDGTPIYPVRSGVVTESRAMKVFVTSSGGTVFQYWHIVPAVTAGQRVVVDTTILGRVRRTYGHVHFAEVDRGRVTNPLAPGHLTPYDDHTTPNVGPIEFRRPGTADELLPVLIRGRVEIDVPAYDFPTQEAPGRWAAMPTVPAVITWHMTRVATGATLVHERTAFDVRARLPQGELWRVYARGTRQDMPTFRRHRYTREPGLFVFRLGDLDTRRLTNGVYAVVATASDVRGNEAITRAVFLIYNQPAWPPEEHQG